MPKATIQGEGSAPYQFVNTERAVQSAHLLMQMIRSLASFLLSVTVAQAQGLKTWFGSRKYWPYFAARGFTGAASMTLYYEAIARMPLADAVRHCQAICLTVISLDHHLKT